MCAQRTHIRRPHSGRMNTDQMSAESRSERVWSAPESESPRWGLRQTLAAVGVAAVIAGLGGAAIYAATDDGSASMGAGAPPAFGPGGPGGTSGGPGGMPGPGGPPPGAMRGSGPDAMGAPPLHGEFVVPASSGGYTTMLTQTGTVTAISADVHHRSQRGRLYTDLRDPVDVRRNRCVTRGERPGHGQRDTDRSNRHRDRHRKPQLGGPGGPPHRN